MTYYTVTGIIRSSTPVLLLAAIAGLLAGQMLNSEIERIITMPSLLILIPALIKIGGDTGSILAARLASAFHLGLESRIFRNPVMSNSLIGVTIVAMTALFSLSVIVWVVSFLLGHSVSFLVLLQICYIAGIIEIVIVFFFTITISSASHKYGLDPDDTVIPLIATLGDIVGVAGIIFALNILLVV
ncbi:magnesium transporter [Methanosalsum natronophilum]|uniref:magnesium transporter n=1 Tax=Methanosalsum natronophilum TaxID=768733 RepID=UPI0021678FEE|nr:magnesium transporter [Methanosalsum natronophilum]MCS3924162.1 mgtE-like transporter [Methanosalsum natronophilum]